jgi:hypothetical protein
LNSVAPLKNSLSLSLSLYIYIYIIWFMLRLANILIEVLL